MPLQIPTRKSPVRSSFPTSPDDVRDWVAELNTMPEGDRQRQLLRGLKHSNRLESNNRNRVEVLAILEPAVDTVLDDLAELYFEQPLPLPRKPLNAYKLAGSLLRELGYGWNIVVNDTYSSLLGGQSGLRAVAILHALRIMGKTILHHSLVYSPVPPRLLADANNLYRLAEESGLEQEPQTLFDGSETWSIQLAYLHLQMQSLAAFQAQRLRQIPLISNFLETLADHIELGKAQRRYPQHESWLGIHPEQDSPPQRWQQFSPAQRRSLRVFNLDNLHPQLIRAEKSAPESLARELETQVLRRRSISRVLEQLHSDVPRRSQRLICSRQIAAQPGIKEIHALLARKVALHGKGTKVNAAESAESWRVINSSQQGVCLEWDGGRASDLQVGELIALLPSPEAAETPHSLLRVSRPDKLSSMQIGSVVWVQYQSENILRCGVELISDEVAAVLVEGTTANTEGSRLECLLCIQTPSVPPTLTTKHTGAGSAAEESKSSLPQRTLMAPPHTFQESGSLRVHHRGKSSDWLVKSRLNCTGGFDFFELAPRTINPAS